MKKQSSNLFTQTGTEQNENLVKEVKETIEFGLGNNQGRSFTPTDLWNIHRQRRSLSSRRQFV